MKDKKEFISEIDYNKSSKGCSPCLSECKKINDRINKRNLSDIKDKEVPHILIKDKEVPHILKVFDF